MRSKMSTIGTSDSAFHDGNPSTGELGTIVTADWLNAVQASTMDLQDELLNVLAAATIANDPAVKTQILAAINKLSKLNIQSGSATFATDTGVANAYLLSLTPALTLPRGEGQVIRFKVTNTNNGACTVNDGAGVSPLVGLALSALQGGEMVAGGTAWIQWHPSVGTGSYVLLFCTGAALQITPPSKPNHAVNNGQLIGSVSFFAMSSAPSGWLKANGAAISRTTYSALFAAIGTIFGAGDGSTTFNVPDLRGEFLRGFDDGRGVDSSRVLGAYQSDLVKSHRHAIAEGYDRATTSGGSYVLDNEQFPILGKGFLSNAPTYTNADDTSSYHSNTTYSGGTETRPRNVALLACIKY